MKWLLLFIAILVISGAFFYINFIDSPYSSKVKRTIFGEKESMVIKSDSFVNNGSIPSKFTCDGESVSPGINFFTVPVESKSLALIVEDLDSSPPDFTHWIIFNLNPISNGIEENNAPDDAVEGLNDFGETHYSGPCPNSQNSHRYLFKLYSLDVMLDLQKGASKAQVISKIKGHILDEAELTGIYQKQ